MNANQAKIAARYVISAAAAVFCLGCAAVPRGQVEEARSQILALRTELAQSKDTATRLRTQNRDISARAVEDARQIAALEDSNAKLEESVAAYQDEREKYAAALNRIKNEIASASSEAVRRQ